MAASTSKKVIVHRFDRPPVTGYLEAASGVGNTHIEVLTPEGVLRQLPRAEVKAVCFVREFGGAGLDGQLRSFRNRPKAPGLWVRLLFRDSDFLEGTIPNDLLAVEQAGLTIAPPDASETARVFVPREALKSCSVLGVVGRGGRRGKAPAAEDQRSLFDS